MSSSPRTNKAPYMVCLILIAAAILTILYIKPVPLGGAESTSVLQGAGRTDNYQSMLPEGIVTSMYMRQFASYSSSCSIKNVFDSLKRAGMHPPFYYLLLHFILKYFGNGAFILHLFSVACSLASLALVYFVGKAVCNKQVGLLSALTLAFSAHVMQYGVIVRPYPMAMFLALATTLLALKLKQPRELKFMNPFIYLYAFLVALGLYTIYHFLFVFIFQLAFLGMHNLRQKKSLLVFVFICSGVFLLYLPWLPYLREQIKTVTAAQYYFYGQYSLMDLFRSFINTSFLRFFYQTPRIVRSAVGVFIYITMMIGIFKLSRNKHGLSLLLALLVYLLSYLLADLLLKMRTLTVVKLYFFIAPMQHILLSTGLISVSNRCKRSLMVALLCAIIMVNTIYAFRLPPPYSMPSETWTFANRIDHYLKNNQKGLVFMNTVQRRFVFPFLLELDKTIDLSFLHHKKSGSWPQLISHFDSYDYIFLVNFYVPYEEDSFLSPQTRFEIEKLLETWNFDALDRSNEADLPKRSAMLVYRKTDPLHAKTRFGTRFPIFRASFF